MLISYILVKAVKTPELNTYVMKKVLYICLASTMFLLSCSSDDSVPLTHEMGEWELNSFILSDLPEGFEGREGVIVAINALRFGGSVFEQYELSLNSDQTYSRKITFEVGPSARDNGTWVLDEDDFLILTNEDGDDIEFEIVQNRNEQLWWAEPANFTMFHDSVTSEDLEGLTDEEEEALLNIVPLNLVYAFERVEE